MLTALLGWLGGPIFGSVIGGWFGLMNRYMDTKTKAIDLAEEDKKRQHELLLKDKDLAYMQAEALAKKEVVVSEGLSREEVARFESLAKVQETDQISSGLIESAGSLKWLFVLVDALRRATRPVLTWLVAGSMIYLSMRFALMIPGASEAEKAALIKESFYWISGQASMILGYWFVGRGTPK
jgi:hypothetical protein